MEVITEMFLRQKIYEKAVIFYSYEGNTKFMAESIAKEIEADLIELKPKNEKI